MRIALNPDLFVTTAETITARSFVFPASLGDGLRAIDGVGEVQPVRSVRVLVKDTPVMLVAVDIERVARRTKLPPVEGDPVEMYREAAAGKGVVASENFARLHGAQLGEVLEIPSPGGMLRCRCRHRARFFGSAGQLADFARCVLCATGMTIR